MLLKTILYAGVLVLVGGCTSPFAALHIAKENGAVLEEMRTEIADLKHSLHATEIELHLLEEKIDTQTCSKTSYLEERITLLEKTQNKVSHDLKQTAHVLDRKIGDMDKIKGALSSLSHYIETKKPSTYRVQEGDSLSKIAQTYATSVDALKVLNHLEGDKILIGQLLKLPDSHDKP